MTTEKHKAQLQEMLEEARAMRENIEAISESLGRFTEAISNVLDEQTEAGSFDDAYRAMHEDL